MSIEHQNNIKECSSDEEDAGFHFESPVKYDPNRKMPFLSPKTPQLDKLFHDKDGPLSFRLVSVRQFPSTPQPKRYKNEENVDINLIHKNNVSLTPKKVRSPDLEAFLSSDRDSDEMFFRPVGLNSQMMSQTVDDDLFRW
ncbi:hypothetical protein TRFO_41555 [Tritrichomonas foetus]|uniref:Uncharacterized protein n=1 Tax=Tritrichomonas foetus TaxID=1144522 RepID=A0A1J4L124_9EUKA|nr:hypothetical protein TRFO_41555 [Tritrichomonas foetus]|eukprot:OHT16784.1 hypothetical protein TRFO_41555 [Tritrichomonas foetus]